MPGVLIEIEGESFRCVCGVGSYLIHSPRGSSDPPRRLFHRERRTEHDGYGRKERTTGRETRVRSGNRCLVQNAALIQTDRVDADFSRDDERAIHGIFLTDIMCYDTITITE